MVHRVGRELDVRQKQRYRNVRDLLCKSAKKSSFFIEKKLRFAEDLTAVESAAVRCCSCTKRRPEGIFCQD